MALNESTFDSEKGPVLCECESVGYIAFSSHRWVTKSGVVVVFHSESIKCIFIRFISPLEKCDLQCS